MITLDASLVIAHLEPRDPHHDPATSFLREYAGQPLLIHPLNLTEVLVGGVRSGRGRELMDDLGAIGIDVASPEDTDPLRLATLRVETGLKLPDCCALDTALRTGSTLATLDDRLAAAARARHLTVRPTLG
ncbi:type II toxin-antitoxin system VapC family toxin [Serinicoccus profundi]|uniref:type II toxin-antitoxin system VapC family toxin n=1 Tax=Serinicoccus profundi TaxID=1078471 RepID=UPI000255F820|nr:type II toxin-antitoxin system VapC family toxin [Serinicoccus profundi]